MALIWKPSYSTGVERLDEQHRHIFDLLNQLDSATRAGAHNTFETRSTIRQIGALLVEHFACEEGCMDRVNCPMADKNRREHETLLRLYLDFTDKFRVKPGPATIKAFHSQAEQWLLEHVCFVDIHLRSCPGLGERNH